MKITNLHSNKVDVYRKSSATGALQKSEKASSSAKTDVAVFSHGATVTDKAMLGMKSGIQSYLAAPAALDKLESLRQGVKDGTYRVETDDIVNAILGLERTV